MHMRAAVEIVDPDGKRLEARESIVYLGSSVAIDGHSDPELSRRIGMANAVFNDLQKGVAGDPERTLSAIANRAKCIPWVLCAVVIDEIE